MNRIRKPLALVSIILSFVAFALAVGRTGAAREAGLPQLLLLRGQDAVRFLNDVDTQEPLATGAFIEQARLLAADGLSQDNMGFSVAISGDTAVVGAPADAVNSKNRQGSAYVYVRTGKSWTQQQKLLASDGAANDEFGYSVAIVGDTIAVGRHNTQTGVNRTRGSVYVFKRTGATWAEQQILTANDGVEGDLFGNSLAFENDTLIVGALQKNIGSNFFQGAAYVFTRSGASSSFAQQARLTADDGGFADFFGYSVAVSGDTAVVGATGLAGADAASGRGRAYVYVRSGSTWTQQQKLLASDGASGDAFGFSVGISGDTAVIGARADVVGSAGEVGSAYIFTRAGNAWTEQQKLTAAETTPRNDFFGHSVAISGDTIAIGSPAHEFLASIANHGAVYVFGRTGAVWTRQQKLVHADAAPDSLGQAVAFDGSSILAGAPAKASARGAAYVFAREAVDPNRVNGAETLQSSFFGRSVDMDGDTVIVGADFDTIDGTFNGTRTGAAYIFVRTGATWTQQARLLPPDGATNDHFGWDVAISGDTAIVGAYDHKVGANTFQGAVYVFTRSGASWTLQQKLTTNDGGASDSFGYSVALDGDTAVIGAVGDDIVTTNDNRGSAYVFTRTGTTWTQQTKFNAQADKAGTGFGTDVAVSGNTALVGHPLETIGTTPNQGAAYIFTRAGATWTEQQRIFTASGEQGDVFGISVALDGETAVVGSAQGSSSTASKGTAYVYVRANSAWTLQQKLLSSDLEFNDYLGRSLDIDGDTIILGAFGDTVGTNNGQGSAYIFKRANSNWTEQQHLSAADGSEFDFFGISVAVSGDRAIVGAHTDDIAGMQDRGSAYIFALGAVNPTPTPTPTATATPTPTATATPTPTPATATVQFGAASYEVGEAEGRATVTVTLSAASAGAASVDYRTIDADTFTVSCADATNNNGGAFARCDFATSVGRLDFAPGETQKTIIIPIVNDGHDEGAETFQVVLSNPSGAAVAGVPFTTTVTVQDDDSASTTNPIFTTPFFVRQHYLDFLSREPEANEPWSAVLNNCPNVNNNPSCDRILVSQSFFSSPEFRLKGFYVFRFYKLAFNRLPEYTEVVSDMSFVAGATPEEVYARKAQLATAFTQRQEFQTAYGNLSNAAYVAAIFGRYGLSQVNTPDPQQPDGTAKVKLTTGDLISQLDSGVLTRAQVLRAVADSDEADVREFENAFVAMQYYGYLRRKPEAAGYEAWLEVLRRGDVRTMVDGFMNSTEYKLRFGRL